MHVGLLVGPASAGVSCRGGRLSSNRTSHNARPAAGQEQSLPRLEANTIPVLSGSHVRPAMNLLSFVRGTGLAPAWTSTPHGVPPETVARLKRDPLVVR